MLTDPDRHAAGNRLHDTKDRMNKEDPVQGIPEWLQPFTENLDYLETHVPTHTSERENSDSEGLFKSGRFLQKTTRKHRIYTHFPKDRNCDVRLRTNITRSPCRTRLKGSIPRAEKFGDMKTADHKILNEEVNLGTIIDTLLWYKIWPLNGYNPFRVEPKLHKRKSTKVS